MTTPPYTSARVASLRKLIEKASNAGEALDLLERETGLHRDSLRRLNRRHGFYQTVPGTKGMVLHYESKTGKGPLVEVITPPARPPVLGDVLATIRAKGRDKAARVAAPVSGRPLRRLFLDIETSPNVVLSWRIGYKINIDHSNLLKERAIICVAWKWEEDSEVHCLTWDRNQCDKAMLIKVAAVVAQADEIVGHNLGEFDLPWLKTRMLFHGLPPLPDVKVVDTLSWARRQFYFNSNKLDYLGSFLGFGGKIKTEFGLWKAVVLDRCAKALAQMVTYCKGDVLLLQKVWARLAVTVSVKTHVGVLAGGARWTCPRTGSTNVKVSKTRVTAAGTTQYQMQNVETGTYYSINESAHREYLEAKDSAPSKVAR